MKVVKTIPLAEKVGNAASERENLGFGGNTG
jgi:hypothetical protein